MSIHIEPLVVPQDQRVLVSVCGLAPHTSYTIRLRSRRQEGSGLEQTLESDGAGCLAVEHTFPARRAVA